MKNKKIVFVIIIIVVVIVVLGIVGIIWNENNKLVISTNMDGREDAIRIHNSKFTQYEGTERGPAIRKGLVETVIKYNNSRETLQENRISIKGVVNLDNEFNATPIFDSEFKDANYYDVKITGYNNEGYITEITVMEKKGENNVY